MSSYFKRFPLLVGYQLENRKYDVIDITKRTGFVAMPKEDLEEISFEYSIKDGETPEMLADRIYDDVDMYWIILLFNNIFDIYTQWPMSYRELNLYMEKEYGENKYSIRHYVSLATNAIVENDHPDYDRIPVTNYEYETQLNEERKSIRIPLPQAANLIVSQHKEKIRK